MRYKKRGKMAGKSNKLKIKKLQINLTNRWLYTLIVFFSLIVIGVGVYALAPGGSGDPGHNIDSIGPPTGCGDNQYLQWDGSAWACAEGGGGSLWTLTDSDIYYNDGNVGIGTTTPGEKLTVVGSIQAASYAFISSVHSQTDTVLGYNVKYDPDDSDRLNVVSGHENVHPQAIILGPDEGIRFLTSDSNTDGAGADWLLDSHEKMRITPDGNVGIGTTSPTSDYMLDVTGDAYFSGGIALEHMSEINTRPYLEDEATLWINYRGTSNSDQFRNTAIRDGRDNTIFYVQGSTGKVGIGTTEPGAKLDVAGGALISGNLHVGGFAAYSGAFIGYYDGTCDIGHTGVIRYVEDYCNGYVYMAGLQVCTKTGTDTASWKFANSYSYGSCGSPGGGDHGGCFPAGTKVIMFDNSLKNIEDIKEGDYVLSYNEESGEYVSSKVEKLLVHTEENTEKWSEGLYNIFTSDGSNRKITGNHPVYTKTDEGWKYNNVENLVLGDAVKIYNNGEPKEVYIVSIDFIEEDLEVVYNLRLTKPNTYFAERLLVHNLKEDPFPI